MYMFKYVMKRLGLVIMTFVIIMFMCFVLIKLLPITITVQVGQDANVIVRQLEGRGYIQNAVMDAATQTWSYDRVPIMTQLGIYLKKIFVLGDFGIGVNIPSYRGLPVLDVFLEKLPPSVLINVYSTLIGVPLGLGLGIFAALKKNKWQDQAINLFVILMISVPSIVKGLLIQYFLCFKAGWFPTTMNSGYEYFTWSMFWSMMPPVLSLCFGSVAHYARYTRAELSEVLTNEFMLLARTKGLTKGQATFRHAMRNSMVVIFPSILSEFIGVLGGSMIIENMFSVPGVGRLYLDSILSIDYDFFMMLSGFYTLVGLVGSIVIDISYGFIDPRD